MSLLKVNNSTTTQIVRNYGVNVYRKKKGLPPRYAYSPLSETPEFSYLDERGYAPLNKRQQARYERDQHFGKQVIKYMDQFKLARELVQQSKANAERYKLDDGAKEWTLHKATFAANRIGPVDRNC